MTNEQIKHSIETGVLKLGTWNKATHYGIVGFLLLIPVIFIFFHLKASVEGITRPLRDGEIWFIIIPSILGLLFYRLQKNRLKFKTIDTELTREQLDPIIKKITNELGWVPVTVNKKVIVVKTFPGFFSGSWGEQITILFDNNKVLVNSICDPNERSSIVSMGRNKKNMDSLIEEIKKASH